MYIFVSRNYFPTIRSKCFIGVFIFENLIGRKGTLKDLNAIVAAYENGSDKLQLYYIPNPESPIASEEEKFSVSFEAALLKRGKVKYFMDSLRSAFANFRACESHNYKVQNAIYGWAPFILNLAINKRAVPFIKKHISGVMKKVRI
jgi:hypothetical protein